MSREDQRYLKRKCVERCSDGWVVTKLLVLVKLTDNIGLRNHGNTKAGLVECAECPSMGHRRKDTRENVGRKEASPYMHAAEHCANVFTGPSMNRSRRSGLTLKKLCSVLR
jgi:hypothetical protein